MNDKEKKEKETKTERKPTKKQQAKVLLLAVLNLRKRNSLIAFWVKGENQVKISVCTGNTASVFMSKLFLQTRDRKDNQWKLHSAITSFSPERDLWLFWPRLWNSNTFCRLGWSKQRALQWHWKLHLSPSKSNYVKMGNSLCPCLTCHITGEVEQTLVSNQMIPYHSWSFAFLDMWNQTVWYSGKVKWQRLPFNKSSNFSMCPLLTAAGFWKQGQHLARPKQPRAKSTQVGQQVGGTARSGDSTGGTVHTHLLSTRQCKRGPGALTEGFSLYHALPTFALHRAARQLRGGPEAARPSSGLSSGIAGPTFM